MSNKQNANSLKRIRLMWDCDLKTLSEKHCITVRGQPFWQVCPKSVLHHPQVMLQSPSPSWSVAFSSSSPVSPAWSSASYPICCSTACLLPSVLRATQRLPVPLVYRLVTRLAIPAVYNKMVLFFRHKFISDQSVNHFKGMCTSRIWSWMLFDGYGGKLCAALSWNIYFW